MVVLLFTSVAGCLDEAAPVDEPIVSESGPRAIRLADGNATGPANLTDITSFHWSTQRDIGPTTLQLTFDFGNGTDCLIGSEQQSAGASRNALVLYGEQGWSHGYQGETVTARAAGLDTRDLLGESPGSAGLGSYRRGDHVGQQTLTIIRPDAGMPDGSPWLDHSIAIGVECDRPFSVIGARFGDVSHIFRPTDLGGDAAAEASLVGNAVANGATTRTVDNGTGHVRVGSFGEQVGEGRIISPDGQAAFSLPLDVDAHLSGGPGEYGVELTRIGVWFEAFWAAIYSLDSDVDLRYGLQEDRVIRDPWA